MAKKKTKKRQSFGRRHQLSLLLISSAAVLFCILAAVFGLHRYSGPEAWVNIPARATSAQVHDSLQSALGSVDGNRVFMLWKLSGGSAERAHGRYRVGKGEFSWRTAWNLRGAMQTPVRLTWNSVRTMDQLASRVSRQFDFTPEEFLAAADTVLSTEGFSKAGYPAAFIPDSYEFYATSTPESVVKRLVDYRNRFWNADRLAKAHALGINPIEVATIASIVEEESAKTDEWPVIARLYLNRLHSGMPLQADPTVKFATGDFSIRRINSSHLATESPYNTYRRRGLPPGPIRVASSTAIDAVLDAPKHAYLYMCAREDFSGRHNFTSSYEEHRQNAARYQAELNRRGIK